MPSEQMQQLRDQIERVRAAITRDEQILAEAMAGGDNYGIHTLGILLEHQRAFLAALLEEHAQLALGDLVAE